MVGDRSTEVIDVGDLARLAEVAAQDRDRFFAKRPEYRHRVVATVLCQRAALHYVDVATGKRRQNGIKDFDVWTFFAAVPGERFPADRRNTHVDLGASKFGHYPGESSRFRRYQGRRIDLLMRALPVEPTIDPAAALLDYLTEARTTTAQWLAEKAVVLLDPVARRGEIVWPVDAFTTRRRATTGRRW